MAGDDWGELPATPPVAPEPGSGAAPTPAFGEPVALADRIRPAETTGTGGGGPGRSGRWRDRGATVLAVLAVVALFGANLAWWVSHDVFDTPTVTAKAGQLLASPDTRAAVTAVLDERVIQPALSQATGTLPEPFQSLGGLVQAQTGSLVQDDIATAVASETVSEVTQRLVAVINTQLVEGSGPIELTPTQLIAILAPSLVDNRIVSGLVDLVESTGCCTVVLAERSDLPFVWQHVELIRTLATVLPIVALVLAIAALLVARRRRRAGLVLAVGVAVSGAVVLLALWAGVRWGVDLIGDPSQGSTALVRQALRITSDVTVGDLRRQCWILLVAGSLATGVLAVASVSSRGAGPVGAPGTGA